MQFDGMANGELEAVSNGTKSVSEALDNLQVNAQAMLDQAVEAEGTKSE